MAFWDDFVSIWTRPGKGGAGPLEEARFLDVPSGSNYRDLGGYPTPTGLTRYRRFVRAGIKNVVIRVVGVIAEADIREEVNIMM